MKWSLIYGRPNPGISFPLTVESWRKTIFNLPSVGYGRPTTPAISSAHEFRFQTPVQIRAYSTAIEPSIIPRTVQESGFAAIPSRSLLIIDGQDAASFLQGLITANISSSSHASATVGQGPMPHAIYSAFLNAQGRLLHDVFIYPLPPHAPVLESMIDSRTHPVESPCFVIEVDRPQSENLLKWLRRYKLRSKVNLRRVNDSEVGVFFLWNDSRTVSMSLDLIRSLVSNGAHAALDARAPSLGMRVLAAPKIARLQPPNCSTIDYNLRRYLRGLPEGSKELQTGMALVHDSSLDKAGAVDFKKGCYVGQELVIRTRHTGVVRKRILPAVLYPFDKEAPASLTDAYAPLDADVKPGAEIWRSGDFVSTHLGFSENKKKRPRPVGTWIAGVGNVGIASVRLEPMVGIGPIGESIHGWKEHKFEVRESLDGNGQIWGAKAYVPDWWASIVK